MIKVNAALFVMQSSNNLKIIPPKLESGMWSVECELKSTSQSSSKYSSSIENNHILKFKY
ncbi:hypothetical protein Avbf_15497 [Armadillidium vulgare]|nr:hypothetical protein Avbf_15497 [Armadillidium vulgare]